LQAANGNATFPHIQTIQGFRTVAKPDLGTKRLCASCGAKFYDLAKTPIVCPKCETVFVIAPPVVRGGAAAAASAAAAAAATAARNKAKEAADAVENRDSELVSLEDADAEASGGKKGEDDDLEVEETEEAPFIEETEDGDDDVTDIIGDGRETEEES
jgi:uncharacterized protein (TIGR02300 family)